MKTSLMVTIMACFLTFGLAGNVFAENTTDNSSALGTGLFSFDKYDAQDYAAAKGYTYDQASLKRLGTEAGNWQFRFDKPVTKAELAARNHVYDPAELRMVGTEMGYDSYVHEMHLQCPLC